MEATNGRQLRDFIYAPDAADLLVRLLFSTATGVFNVGTGVGTPVRRVIEYVAEHRGGRDLVIFGAREPALGELPMLVADMAKVQRVLGWSPSMPLEAGLDRVLAEGSPSCR
jgi:UDP-glucose 4-epimerase